MVKTKTLYVRISDDRFIPVEIAEPQGDWFTDAHIQEILVAIADSFYDLYALTTPKIYRTPRCSFSIFTAPRSARTYGFIPYEDSGAVHALSCLPKVFCIRVLGKGDVGMKIKAKGQATLDSAMRIIYNAG